MSKTVPPIGMGSITGLAGKRDRPVFFVKLNGSPTENLVIKGDVVTDHSETSIPWGSKMMKNVQNSLVNVKLMKPDEIVEFQQAAHATFDEGTPQHTFSTGDFCWVKMPFVAGLTDGDFIDEKTNKVNGKTLREVVTKFSNTAVWAELGKVVAVDVFIGNNDRFVVTPDGNSKPGDWQNLGNVMFLSPGFGHTTPVIGLDIFDANSNVSNLQSVGGFEQLKVLKDANKRNEYALACARGVGNKIKARMKLAGVYKLTMKIPQGDGYTTLTITPETAENLFEAYADDFSIGLNMGAQQLKLYLQQKVQQYMPGRPLNGAPPRPQTPLPGQFPPRPQTPSPAFQGPPAKTIPQGILDRMDYLGW
jgi:hypothetical protein